MLSSSATFSSNPASVQQPSDVLCYNVRALITRIGSGGILYYNCTKESPKLYSIYKAPTLLLLACLLCRLYCELCFPTCWLPFCLFVSCALRPFACWEVAVLLASPEHVGLALCACHLKTYGSLSMSMSSMLCFEALGILCGLVTCLILSVAMRSRMLSACRFCMRCFCWCFARCVLPCV